MEQLQVIWCQEERLEERWIREILSDWELIERRASNLDLWAEDALYVLSSNVHPLDHIPDRFWQGLQQLNRKGLFHLSDEWLCGGYECYREFDWVVTELLVGVLRVSRNPRGTARLCERQRPYSASASGGRKFLFSLAGNLNAARQEMIRSLQSIQAHFFCICTEGECRRQEGCLGKSISCCCRTASSVLPYGECDDGDLPGVRGP